MSKATFVWTLTGSGLLQTLRPFFPWGQGPRSMSCFRLNAKTQPFQGIPNCCLRLACKCFGFRRGSQRRACLCLIRWGRVPSCDALLMHYAIERVHGSPPLPKLSHRVLVAKERSWGASFREAFSRHLRVQEGNIPLTTCGNAAELRIQSELKRPGARSPLRQSLQPRQVGWIRAGRGTRGQTVTTLRARW